MLKYIKVDSNPQGDIEPLIIVFIIYFRLFFKMIFTNQNYRTSKNLENNYITN